MGRIDDIINKQEYILMVLRAYREITQSGCCNDCASSGECEYRPKWGEPIRYNCPFYKSLEEKWKN